MSDLAQRRLRMLVLLIAPIVLLVGFIAHPFVDNETSTSTIAGKVVDDPDRWAWSHLILTVGVAITLLAVFSVRQILRAHGEDRWSFISIPFLVVGLTLIASVTGAEVLIAGAANAGANVEAVLDDADPWLTPVYGVAAVSLAIGWLSLAGAVYRSHILPREQSWVAVIALVVVAAAAFIPATWGGYIIGVAALVALWLIGYRVWVESRAPAPGGQQLYQA